MRWYHKLFLVFGILGILVLFIFFGLKIDTVHVEGTKMYTESEIQKSVFTRKFSHNTLFFAIYNKMYGINKLPFVEEIDVTYHSLNTVTLHVYDKTISGCIRYMGQYIYFDKDGTVLQSMTEKKKDVLVVTGIQFGTFTVGKKFHVKDDSMFTMIMNLSRLVSHYGIAVDRIHVNDNDVKLYSGNVTVSLGKKEIYDDELSALSSVLETTAKKKLSGTIDMKNYQSGDKIILKTSKDKKEKTKKRKRIKSKEKG